MSKNIYNVIYIGSGPATIFSVLSNPIPNSLIIEKGNSIKTRTRSEVLEGFAGSGAWSDSKLVANPLVGGNILKILPDLDFDKYADQILNLYNKFYNGKPFTWKMPSDYEFPSDKLKLLKSKVCHIGTDNSAEIFLAIETWILKNACNIVFNEEIIDIVKCGDYYKLTGKTAVYNAYNVCIATGKHDLLLPDVINKFHVKTIPNDIQIGVRVEADAKPFKKLIDDFYDFKLVMNTLTGRFRSFCVNAGAAFISVENSENFISANGHAYANKQNNGLVNFGVIGELKSDMTKEEQIQLMKTVNGSDNTLICQDIDNYLNCYENNLHVNSNLSNKFILTIFNPIKLTITILNNNIIKFINKIFNNNNNKFILKIISDKFKVIIYKYINIYINKKIYKDKIYKNIDNVTNTSTIRGGIKTSLKDDKIYRIDDLNKYYPPYILHGLYDYFKELKKHVKFKGHFFAPEIKLTNNILSMNKHFEIYPGIFVIGDVCLGRSIIQSGIMGILVGEYLKSKIKINNNISQTEIVNMSI